MAELNLEKKFVWVSGTGEKKITDLTTELQKEDGKYYKSIVFDHVNGVIWNHGRQYGISDAALTALSTAVKTLESQVQTETTGLLDRVTSIESLIGAAGDEDDTINKLQEVLDWFAGIKESKDPYTVTVDGKEVSLGKGQAGLLATVAENKQAIGEKATSGTPEVSHNATQEDVDAGKAENIGDKVVDTPASEGTPSTGLYKEIEDVEAKVDAIVGELPEGETIAEAIESVEKEIGDIDSLGKDPEGEDKEDSHVKDSEDIVDAINDLDDAILAIESKISSMHIEETTVGEGNVKVTYSEEDGIVTISKVDVSETTGIFTEAVEASEGVDATPANLSVSEEDKSKLLNAGALANIKSYVDAVASANQEGLTIASGSENYLSVDATDDHKIGVKTTALGTAVGLTKNEDGEYVAANGELSEAPGLAMAADVVAEIVADEAVVAAALNSQNERLSEHDSRISAMENWPEYDWLEL